MSLRRLLLTLLLAIIAGIGSSSVSKAADLGDGQRGSSTGISSVVGVYNYDETPNSSFRGVVH
jgi:hypothetical protein